MAAGDRRDDASGATAALETVIADQPDHTGNGHDDEPRALPAPPAGDADDPTDRLPVVADDDQPALGRATEGPPTADVEPVTTAVEPVTTAVEPVTTAVEPVTSDAVPAEPVALETATPPPPLELPAPTSSAAPPAIKPPAGADDTAADSRSRPPAPLTIAPPVSTDPTPAPAVHPLIAGDPLLTGSTAVAPRRDQPSPVPVPTAETPELLRPFDQAADDTGSLRPRRRWWRGRGEAATAPAGAAEVAAHASTTPAPVMPPGTTPSPSPGSPPRPAPTTSAIGAAALAATAPPVAAQPARSVPAPSGESSGPQARTARRGERDVTGATARAEPTRSAHATAATAATATTAAARARPTAVAPAPHVVGRRPRVRRVTRVVRSVDPWSVFKVGAVFSVVAYGITLVAGVLLWNVAYATGTIDNIERGMESTGWDSFELNGGEIFHNLWIGGLFVAVGLTGAAVLVATLFNLITDLVGGVRFTVLEEEVIERPASPIRRFSSGPGAPRQREPC